MQNMAERYDCRQFFVYIFTAAVILPIQLHMASTTESRNHINYNRLIQNNFSSYVPIFLSDIKLSTNNDHTAALIPSGDSSTSSLLRTTNNNYNASKMSSIVYKVPSLKNSTNGNSSSSSSSSSSSTTSSSSTNNKNVMIFVQNMDARLRNIRDIEMGVTTIQEIFDAMNFKTVTSDDENSFNTLQKFSKRLLKKLQRASHIVMDLKNYFRYNITEMINNELRKLEKNVLLTENELLRFLNTVIEPCLIKDDTRSGTATTTANNLGQNYDKNQIEIFNYLKNTNNRRMLNGIDDEFVTGDSSYHFSDRSYFVNEKIFEKIRHLSAAVKLPLSTTTTTATKTSKGSEDIDSTLSINNLKNVFFLSRNDYASDYGCQIYLNDLHYRYLLVSAIIRKHIFLLIDIGNALNTEHLDLLKSFSSNIIQMLSNTDTITIVTLSDTAIPMNLSSNQMANDHFYIYQTTDDRKEQILNFIDNLKRSTELTNHSLGFQYAFELLKLQNNELLTEQNPIELVYITRGLLTRLSDAATVLSVIANGQKNLLNPIVINTCAVILDKKRIMYEKQFLLDIAQQNYTKYNIDVSIWCDEQKHVQLVGNFFVITKSNPEKIIRTSTAIFENLFNERFLTQSLEVHFPAIDGYEKNSIVSITHSVPPYGVVGVNLFLSDLVEDVINYSIKSSSHESSYAFLIDIDGRTLAHPALQRPIAQRYTPFPVDIALLENSTNFIEIRKRMLHEQTGTFTTSIQHSSNKMHERTYIWQGVLEMYVICLVKTISSSLLSPASADPSTMAHQLPLPKFNLNQFDQTEYAVPLELLYHRIDLVPPQTPVCRHFRQLATLDAGTVFLSAAAFQSPFAYMRRNHDSSCETTKIRTVQSIMAYIKDNTGLLANPGLRPQIRYDVSVLYNVIQHLKKRHQDANGSMKNYIIRRYAATISGVLQVYPGCILDIDYDPLRRPWFRKAIQHAGKIVATEPYLDAGGAGYIISIAHTIFEGKANALHSTERDTIVAVVAIDVTYAFFYKLILDTTQFCIGTNIKCLLFENEGYLIAHPSMMEPSTASQNMRRPREHITHKESFLANDILNHKILVTKLACANYENRTIQRYYSFNTSLNGILTNVVHGERIKYQITSIRGTNLFAAVLNSTYDGGAFCPCSTVDRTCLNCNRMDQTDCECPCECPINDFFMNENYENDMLDITLRKLKNYLKRYYYCEPPTEEDIAGVFVFNGGDTAEASSPISSSHDAAGGYYDDSSNDDLDDADDNDDDDDWNTAAAPSSSSSSSAINSCLNINCDVYATQMDCLAIMGCEWCQLDFDNNPFSTPFCTTQNVCFNGVLNSITPYGNDGILGSAIIDRTPKLPPYSAIGPVGGAIIVLCLVIGLAMYCYRHNLDNNGDQFYVDSMQDDNYGVPLSRFNYDDVPLDGDGGNYDASNSGGSHMLHRNLVHPCGNAIVVPDISPYHMSTGSSYRRPPTTVNVESDHGYSTMTPHEDSENMWFTLAEPLLLSSNSSSNNNGKQRSDSMSIGTSASSLTAINRNQQHYHHNHHHHHHHHHNHQQQQQQQQQLHNKRCSSNLISIDRSPASMRTRPSRQQQNSFIESTGATLSAKTKQLSSSGAAYDGQTILHTSCDDQQMCSHHILAPVTVHRHMEASES